MWPFLVLLGTLVLAHIAKTVMHKTISCIMRIWGWSTKHDSNRSSIINTGTTGKHASKSIARKVKNSRWTQTNNEWEAIPGKQKWILKSRSIGGRRQTGA